MKRYRISTFILVLLFTVLIFFCFFSITLVIQNSNKPPYGFRENYYTFNIYGTSGYSTGDEALINDIIEILKYEETVLVIKNDTNILQIFDINSQLNFGNRPQYFTQNDFNNNINNSALLTNYSLFIPLQYNDTVYLNDIEYNIRDVLPAEHQLNDKYQTYDLITTLSSNYEFYGECFISNMSMQQYEEFTAILNRYGMIYNEKFTRINNKSNIIEALFRKEIMTLIPSILICFYSLNIYFKLLFSKISNTIKVNWIVGANKMNMFRHLLLEILPFIISAIVLGITLSSIIVDRFYQFNNLGVQIISMILSISISLFSFKVAYLNRVKDLFKNGDFQNV